MLLLLLLLLLPFLVRAEEQEKIANVPTFSHSPLQRYYAAQEPNPVYFLSEFPYSCRKT